MRRALLLLFVLAPLGAFCAEVHVQIQKAKLKKSPQWFAPTLAEPALGEPLEVLKSSGEWIQVRSDGVTGWVHRSAVSTKKVRAGRASTVGASRSSADEVTLAGRGFNDIEAAYRKTGGSGNLEAIDAMEARSVDEAQLAAFLRQGGLLAGGGKRKKR